MLRAPIPPLRPFIAAVWHGEGAPASSARESNLPDGNAHLAIRLGGCVLRRHEGIDDLEGHAVSDAVIAGPHERCYLKDVSRSAPSVGALLRPGAIRALFGCPPAELRDRHAPLEVFYPVEVEYLRDRLNSEIDPERRLECLQAWLLARLRPYRGLHPQVALAVQGLRQGRSVGDLVADSGYSHRRFIDRFRDGVGLTPKSYSRLSRFGHALRLAQAGQDWSRIALDAGYSDQPHFIREFRAFAGLSPEAYRRARRRGGRHVLLPEPA